MADPGGVGFNAAGHPLQPSHPKRLPGVARTRSVSRQGRFQPGQPLGGDRRHGWRVKLWSGRSGRESFETGGFTWATAYSRDGRMLSFQGPAGPCRSATRTAVGACFVSSGSGRPRVGPASARMDAPWLWMNPAARFGSGIFNPPNTGSPSRAMTSHCWEPGLPRAWPIVRTDVFWPPAPMTEQLASGCQDRSPTPRPQAPFLLADRSGLQPGQPPPGHGRLDRSARGPVGRRVGSTAPVVVRPPPRTAAGPVHPGRPTTGHSGKDNTVRIWDVGSGRLVREWV